MVKIKKRRFNDARFVSYEFAKENLSIESKFSCTKNANYNLLSVFCYNKEKIIIGGINGELIDNVFYLDEIWVNSEYRNIWVGKRMLTHLTEYLKLNNLKCVYYPHMEVFKSYFDKNLFYCQIAKKSKRKSKGEKRL